jgi:hypothetical protein
MQLADTGFGYDKLGHLAVSTEGKMGERKRSLFCKKAPQKTFINPEPGVSCALGPD